MCGDCFVLHERVSWGRTPLCLRHLPRKGGEGGETNESEVGG